MSPLLLDYLRHILDEADYLSSKVVNLNKAQFIMDETAKRAFVSSLEIIGEATKKVPAEIAAAISRCRMASDFRYAG